MRSHFINDLKQTNGYVYECSWCGSKASQNYFTIPNDMADQHKEFRGKSLCSIRCLNSAMMKKDKQNV